MKRGEWKARAEEVRRMARAGLHDRIIARELGISHQRVFRIRKRLGIPANYRGDGSRVGEGKRLAAEQVARRIDPRKAAALTEEKKRAWGMAS